MESKHYNPIAESHTKVLPILEIYFLKTKAIYVTARGKKILLVKTDYQAWKVKVK